MFPIIVIFLTFAFTSATLHPAKRSGYNCGSSPVDCGNGWCCMAAMMCHPGDPPMCEDLLIQSNYVQAAPYSDLDPDRLTSIGLTISTFPLTTQTATDALPTYTDNVVKTAITSATEILSSSPTAVETAVTTSSMAGAALPTFDRGFVVGGVVAVCMEILMRA